MLPVLILLICAGITGAVRESHAGGDLTWARSLPDALREAKQAGVPVMVSVHSPDCGWCNKLDSETLTDPDVLALSRQFVCVRLDSDVDPDAVLKYHVTAFPATIFLAPSGRDVARIPGFVPAREFIAGMRDALKLARR